MKFVIVQNPPCMPAFHHQNRYWNMAIDATGAALCANLSKESLPPRQSWGFMSAVIDATKISAHQEVHSRAKADLTAYLIRN